MSKELTVVQAAKLENLEIVIRDGKGAFLKVGKALLQIRDEGLYLATHDTFEAYCQERWDLARTSAFQYIEAARVVDNVRHGEHSGATPENERQVRPLTKLKDKDEQSAAWKEAVDTAPQGKVTAAHVEKVVKQRLESKDGAVQIDEPKKPAVPAKAQAIMDRAGEFDEKLRQLDGISHWADPLSQTPAGSALFCAELIAALDEAKRLLRAAKPTALCRDCKGKGCSECAKLGVLFGPKKTAAA